MLKQINGIDQCSSNEALNTSYTKKSYAAEFPDLKYIKHKSFKFIQYFTGT